FGWVLSFVDRESGECPLHLFLRDTEHKAIPGPTQVWGKALGNESKLPFLHQVVVTCNPQRNFRTYGQGRGTRYSSCNEATRWKVSKFRQRVNRLASCSTSPKNL